MNKNRRARIEKAVIMIEEAKDILDECYAEEEEYRDNMPENLQGSEKYEVAEEAVDNLNSAIENLECAIDSANCAAK